MVTFIRKKAVPEQMANIQDVVDQRDVYRRYVLAHGEARPSVDDVFACAKFIIGEIQNGPSDVYSVNELVSLVEAARNDMRPDMQSRLGRFAPLLESPAIGYNEEIQRLRQELF